MDLTDGTRRFATLSIVVPCYNEEETLAYTHDRLVQVAESVNAVGVEIVYVDDGSQDGTPRILREFHERHQRDGSGRTTVTVVEFSRNFGHSNAVLAGLTRATGDLIAIIDADLQDPPEMIPRMMEKLGAEDLDVVYGQRVRRERDSAFKRATAWGFYRVLNVLTGFEIPRDTGDFRLITWQVRDAILELGESDPFIRGIVAWVGFRQAPLPYARDARKYGETKYPFKKMLRFAGLAILSFSSKPLRIGIYVGLVGLLITLGLLVWALTVWMMDLTVPGWASIVAAFLGGQSVILMLLGVIGVYIGRIYTETKGRPRFIVRSERRGKAPQ